MYKISICGRFKENGKLLGGQSIKTINVCKALEEYYGKEEVYKIDTYNWKKSPFKLLKKCIYSMKISQNILIFPAHNGVKIFVPLFVFLNKFFHKKIFYIVIGGWLPEFLENKKILKRQIQKLNKVFVETNKMRIRLEKQEINNVEILPNFKDIKPISEKDLKINYTKPYKVCTFSRVMKEKGIEDAINVIKQINEEAKEEIYRLDIYGLIDENYKKEFDKIKKEFPDYIQYKGYADSNKSTQILKDYYLLLFPTKFRTEGIPGTIIDSLAAAVPVVASKWENVNEIIEEGVTRFYL